MLEVVFTSFLLCHSAIFQVKFHFHLCLCYFDDVSFGSSVNLLVFKFFSYFLVIFSNILLLYWFVAVRICVCVHATH